MRAPLFHSLRLLAAALVLAAAGCGSSSSSSNTDSFVGTWAFQSGAIMPGCPLAIDNIDLTGDVVTITKIDSSHVAMMITGTGVMCDVRFTASDTIAKADANQTCAIMASGQSAVVSVQSWTLTPATSSLSMTMSGSTTVSASGFSLTCMPTATGLMVRTSADAAPGG